MKLKISMLVLALSFAASGAFAKMPAPIAAPAAEAPKGAANKDWLDVCLMENVQQGQTAEIVEKFCVCINKLMADGEKLTVTQWAKMHPRQDKACAKEAGWIAK